MVDLERLDEALTTYDRESAGVWYFPEWVNDLAAAASAYRDMMTNADREWLCRMYMDLDQGECAHAGWVSTRSADGKLCGPVLIIPLEDE